MKQGIVMFSVAVLLLAQITSSAPIPAGEMCPFTDASGRYVTLPCDTQAVVDAKENAQDNIDAYQKDVNQAQMAYTRASWAKEDQSRLADLQSDVTSAQKDLDAQRDIAINQVFDAQNGYLIE